jgi:hypothetical protein
VRIAVVVVLLGLVACSRTTSAPTEASGSSAPVASTAVVVTAVSTVQISTLPTATPGPLISPTVLTEDDNGAVGQLRVGEQVDLQLSPDLTWTVAVDDPSVLRQNGTLYEAAAPGSTMLSAEGEPACRRVSPPCGLPNRVFQARVEVSP